MDLTINTNRQSVNRHSDFALRMSLLKDGEPYTPTSFVMAFYVDEWDCETVYTASLIGGEFINCSISGDVISVYFDHPHFPLGTLKCRVVDKVRDINFKDGTFDTVTPITLPVEIVTGGGTDSVDVGDVAIEGSVGYMPPEGGIPKADLAPDVQTSLGKADTALQSFTEIDPTVPSWAKAQTKPTYTAQEVGALPASTTIPSKTSDLTNDSGFINRALYYGECTTAAATMPKVCTVETFPTTTSGNVTHAKGGTVIAVKFTNSDTNTTDAPTLNVNGIGAKAIMYNNAIVTSTAKNTTVAGTAKVIAYYRYDPDLDGGDGAWEYLGKNVDSNTTYSTMSQAEIDAGTGTTARTITPKLLRDNFYIQTDVDESLAEKEKFIEYDYERELSSDTSQPHGTIGYEADNEWFYFYDSHNGEWIRILDVDSIDNEIVPTTRTINGKALSSNITLTASDVGAMATSHPSNAITSANITAWNNKADKATTYTKTEVDGLVADAGKVKSVTVNGTKHTPDASTGDVDLGNLRGQDGNSGVASADAIESVNNLNGGTTDTSSRVYVLGANQGKRLRDQIDYVYARLQAVYAALGNIAFWDGKTPIANILPDLDWGAPKHTVTLALSLTNAVVKHNGVAKSNGDTILVEEGGTLTLIVEPADGYALTSVTSSTTSATVADLGNGTYSVAIVMGGSNVTLNVVAVASVGGYAVPADGEMVFFLDGKDLTDGATTWVDKVGNVQFTGSGTVVKVDGVPVGMSFNGSNQKMSKDSVLNFSPITHTIEIVAKPVAMNGYKVNYLFTDGEKLANSGGKDYAIHAILYKDGNTMYMNGVYVDGTGTQGQDGSWTGGHVWAMPFTVNANICIGANKTCAVNNGSQMQSLGVTHWTTLGGHSALAAAHAPSNNTFILSNTVVYAVRIYRGQLTVAQMLHNQKIDNERYGLGLTLPDTI